MSDLSILSIFPPLLAIFLSIRTKQVIPSILAGLLLGYTTLSGWNVFSGILDTINALVNVFASEGNTRTIMFTLLIGSMIRLIQHSKGIEGFASKITTTISQSSEPKKRVQQFSALTGLLVFIESNISILTVGALFRPLFQRFGVSREKLAYIADSSSAPSCILFPMNAWGAYIMGLLATYEQLPPFQTLITSIPFNAYPIITIFLVFIAISSKSVLGPMKPFEAAATPEAVNEENEQSTGKARNMLIPIGIMVFSMPLFLIYTGYAEGIGGSWLDRFWYYIGHASGSASVLYAVTLSVLVAGVLYFFQQILTFTDFIKISLEGMSEMLSMAILMVLAFALSGLCKEMGTGLYIAQISEPWLSPALAPAVLFITSCFIAFSTGTSWGTFAIMISIGLPLGLNLGLHIPLVLGAILGGGVFGDHCSPISDTTLISSMATDVQHIDHVRTQLPYALIAGCLAVIFYLIVGFLVG